MAENQIKKPVKTPALHPVFHTILATENKAAEPFIKYFEYSSENIASKHLGRVFGFFEIPDTNEESAYIVNFLASIVKKEYFINPKRGATESFEATLHKINLALTEIVKQGNTSWLGNLHGVVAVLDENTLHFSATGDGSILLYRENTATIISEGLADKDAALHPLKTFLEISSGTLFPEDKLLITSPELFELCTENVLQKNAFRMKEEAFVRFIRAALVNEMPLGVSIIIDIKEKTLPLLSKAKKQAAFNKQEAEKKLQNVFSGTVFTEKKEESLNPETPLEELLPPEEYTDEKTGHIYIQGDDSLENYTEPSAFTRFSQNTLAPLFSSFAIWYKRTSRKTKKQATRLTQTTLQKTGTLTDKALKTSKAAVLKTSQESAELLATRFRETKSRLSQIQKEKPSQEKKPVTEPEKLSLETEEMFREEVKILSEKEEPSSIPKLPYSRDQVLSEPLQNRSDRLAALYKFSHHYQRPERLFFQDKLKKAANAIYDGLGSAPLPRFLHASMNFLWKYTWWQLAIGGIVLFLALSLLISGLRKLDDPKEFQNQAPEQALNAAIEQSENNPQKLSLSDTLTLQNGDTALGEVALSDTTLTVTNKAVYQGNERIAFPGDGTFTTSAYMPDLKILFLWTNKNTLVAYSTVDKKFTENTLPLSNGGKVDAMGAYLTYLYTLDASRGTITRYPRTEGGFSEGSSWLKENLASNVAKGMVVNENVRVIGKTTDQYLRGVKEKTLSEESYNIINLSSKGSFTLAVNTASGKLTVWNTEGNEVHSQVYDELKNIKGIAYQEESKTLSILDSQKVTKSPLSW